MPTGDRNIGTSFALASLLLLLILHLPQTTTAKTSFKLGGYIKDIYWGTETVLSPNSYIMNLTRARLELRLKFGAHLTIEGKCDSSLLASYMSGITEYELYESFQKKPWIDMDFRALESDHLLWDLSIHRAKVKLKGGGFELTLGRQRIALGTSLLWQPTDILNPVSPIALERDERQGIDALHLLYRMGATSRLEAALAPYDSWAESSLIGRLKTTLGSYDLGVIGGKKEEDRVLGGEFMGHIGDSGLYGEGLYRWAEDGEDYFTGSLGWQNQFKDGPFVDVEYFYNGGGASDPADYDPLKLLAGELSLARDYLGGNVGYNITPLFRGELYAIINLDDGGQIYNPSALVSVLPNLDWGWGAIIYNSADGEEYSYYRDLFYTYLKWYF